VAKLVSEYSLTNIALLLFSKGGQVLGRGLVLLRMGWGDHEENYRDDNEPTHTSLDTEQTDRGTITSVTVVFKR